MIVFDLPAPPGTRALRAASLGSCRVTDPLFVLRAKGDLRIRAWGMAAHHTASEALQTLQVITGDLQIPDALSPFVFETPTAPSPAKLAPLLDQGIAVYVVEVSADRQFSYGDFCLQQNFVARELIQPHGRAILPWYREICRGRRPDEACVQLVVENIRRTGTEPGEQLVDLLRHVRLEFQDVDQVAASLAAAMARVGGAWVVVGSAIIETDHGAVMQDRRALNGKVEEAARRCGAAYYDPSEFIVRHGREAVLDENGANIYEFAKSFYPTVGETVVALARKHAPPAARRPRSSPLRRARRFCSGAIDRLRTIVRARRRGPTRT